ncbi:hypothetical protein F2Q69_00050943 [Brassica cretica]|uniref:TFIIS central domain-containing protein n=1 Tax=Brassica cretica TaxID=69181 RepID=A0A8S9Q0U0_BRACR|nr:hypothetical protein F2Q69_00050943 [Brassica cretica]
MRDNSNSDLRRKVLIGEISGERLVTMEKEEMASNKIQMQVQKIKEKARVKGENRVKRRIGLIKLVFELEFDQNIEQENKSYVFYDDHAACLEFLFNHIPKNERLSVAASRLRGEAKSWLEREEEKRWFHNRPAITTWDELQNIMDKRKFLSSSSSQLKLSKTMSDSEGKTNPLAVNISLLQVEAMVSEVMRRLCVDSTKLRIMLHTKLEPHNQPQESQLHAIISGQEELVKKKKEMVPESTNQCLKPEKETQVHSHIPKNERLSVAASRLRGEAKSWLEREEEKRWFHNRPAITTWDELQNIMDKRYIPKDFPAAIKEQYGWRPTPRKFLSSSSSQLKLSKTMSDSEGKTNPLAVNISLLQVEAMVSEVMRRLCVDSTKLRIMLHTKLEPHNQPQESQLHAIISGQEELVKKKKEMVPESTNQCLKPEKETQVVCVHVPDQPNGKEEVLEDSSVVELALILVDQGENTKTLTSEILIKPMSCIQLSLVEHLRVVKGLQQVVFEPGGIWCEFGREENYWFGCWTYWASRIDIWA